MCIIILFFLVSGLLLPSNLYFLVLVILVCNFVVLTLMNEFLPLSQITISHPMITDFNHEILIIRQE